MITQFERYQYYNCDARGVQGPTNVYQVEDGYSFLNEESAKMTEYALKLNQEEDYVVRENYALGLLGAIGGGVLGALLIFLIARIGFVSSYAGLKAVDHKFSVVCCGISCMAISGIPGRHGNGDTGI